MRFRPFAALRPARGPSSHVLTKFRAALEGDAIQPEYRSHTCVQRMLPN